MFIEPEVLERTTATQFTGGGGGANSKMKHKSCMGQRCKCRYVCARYQMVCVCVMQDKNILGEGGGEAV